MFSVSAPPLIIWMENGIQIRQLRIPIPIPEGAGLFPRVKVDEVYINWTHNMVLFIKYVS
jgi:hypothetical protein